MNDKKIMLYIDLAFCFVFLPLLAILIPVEKLIDKHALFLGGVLVYLLCIYYVNRRFNIPALFLKKKFLMGSIIVAILAIMTYFMSHFPFPDDGPNLTPFQLRMRFELRAQMIWFLFLVVMGFCFSFGLLTELFKQRMVKQQIETEKNKAELALYKAQINPHFLFNTLNTLYGLAITQSENMESAFIKFSDILKYMYSNADKDDIPISDEIDYISQYIELQKLRLNDHTKVLFTHKIDNTEAQVPPMVLITFVENAFKYGISSTNDSLIEINLNLEENRLFFTTKNHIFNHPKSDNNGVGIDNCKKRLDLLYDNQYSLIIDKKDDNFAVTLILQLSND